MSTIPVKSATGATVDVQLPLPPGRAAAAASRPVALSTEDNAILAAIVAALTAALPLPAGAATQATLASILAKLITAPATEAKQDAANTSLASIAGYLDTVEALIAAGNALLTAHSGYLDGVEGLLAAKTIASGRPAVSGTFAATGQSAVFAPISGRDFNVTIAGGAGAVQMERSFDAGATWFVSITDSVRVALPPSFTLSEPEYGVQYRLNCTAFTTGPITYRVSQ